MSEDKNLPDGAPSMEDTTDEGVADHDVGVSADTEAENNAETPEDKLERIAAEHDVSIEKDPKDVQAAAEDSVTAGGGRDIRGGDTKEDEDSAEEPPD